MEIDARTVRELQGMIAVKEEVASLTAIETRLREVLHYFSSMPKRKRRKPHNSEERAAALTSANSFGTSDIGLSVIDVPVTFNGLQYPSIMNAFQAQKAPAHCRSVYTECNATEAAKLGREENIDIKQWDECKYDLMMEIFRHFIGQNKQIQKTLMESDLSTMWEDILTDSYWPSLIPSMWRTIQGELDPLSAVSIMTKEDTNAALASASVNDIDGNDTGRDDTGGNDTGSSNGSLKRKEEEGGSSSNG